MWKKLVLVLLVLVFLTDVVSAATISGIVYDISLNKVDAALVEIDSIPRQKYVTRDGSYTFTLDPGSYTIKATSPDLQASSEETIVISQEGDFTVDLILFLTIDDEFINDPGVDLDTSATLSLAILVIILVLVSVAVVILFLIYQRSHKEDKKEEKPKIVVKEVEKIIEVEKKESKEFDKDTTEVLGIIKKADGRITQKDIRKQNPLSEAKVSLIIAELESKGVVKKIKKGRGNIIILVKK